MFADYGKPICSSQSSLIRISRDKVCCFGRISNGMTSFTTSLHAVPSEKFMGETRRTGIQWSNRSLRHDPYRFLDKKSPRSSQLARDITVRADLSGAATPDSSFPEPGFFWLNLCEQISSVLVDYNLHRSFCLLVSVSIHNPFLFFQL
jgi:hypothetical protein